MTLKVIEGFDFMPSSLSNSERARLFSAKGFYVPSVTYGWPVALGRFDFGKCLRFPLQTIINGDINGPTAVKVPIGNSDSAGFTGVAVYVGSGQIASALTLAMWNGAADAAQCSISFELNGIIKVWLGTSRTGTPIIVSDTGAFQEDQWFYVEVGYVCHNTAGSVEVRVNTKTVISLVSADTQALAASTYDLLFLGINYRDDGTVVDFGFDDLYYCDTTGSVNNTFLGNMRVKSQLMVANGAHISWVIGGTSPAASNWQSALNNMLTDVQYNYSLTNGDYDLYEVQAILNAPFVHGVQVSNAFRMDDATQRIGRNLLRTPLGTVDEGVDQYVNQTFTFYKDIWELNPDTGVFFTGTEVNGLQVGPKREA